jgi:hypothetical protein
VAEDFKDADLAGDSLDVCLFDDLLFLEGLHRYLFVGGDVRGYSNFPEGPLANRLPCVSPQLPTLYCPSTNSLFMDC